MEPNPLSNAFKTVLLAEDDVGIRSVLSSLLKMLGLSYHAVEDGKQAIEFLRANPIDVLITDFQMPNVDGIGLLNWCRGQGYHFPVIFISANADLVPREQIALNDCCATLMNKPIDIEALEAALMAALELRHHPKCVHSQSAPV